MDLKTTFMIFGIALALTAVVVSFIGLRTRSFPNRGALIGLLLFTFLLVAGTTTFAVRLSIHEQEEREKGETSIPGEEASVAPLKIPARI